MLAFNPGATCGTYIIVRLLARGAVADVYEAIAHPTGRRALKIIRSPLPLDSKPQGRIAQEAEVLSMIDHVNVLRLYDGGIHEGRVWLGLELVEGADLRQIVRAAGGKLPMDRAVGLIRQACEGVYAAHRQEIVHRALSPENILVTREDLVKVGAFGRAWLPKWGVATTADHQAGTALYMAPELMVPGDRTPVADVYSMGVMLYEIIWGKNPIAPEPETLSTIFSRQVKYEPPALHEVRPETPSDLSLLIQRAMMKDPARRPSMREFADELEVVQRPLLTRRRAAARNNISLPSRGDEFARTEVMPAVEEPALPASPPAPIASPQPDCAEAEPGTGRDALPPPAPAPGSLPATTLRTPPLPAPAAVLPPSSLAAPQAAASLTVSSPPPLAERGSTGVPVESTATPPRALRRPARIAAAAGLLIVLAVAAWWTVLGRDPVRPTVAAQPTVTASVSASPPASPPKRQDVAASASAVPPKAPVRRPGVAAPAARPKLPFR